MKKKMSGFRNMGQFARVFSGILFFALLSSTAESALLTVYESEQSGNPNSAGIVATYNAWLAAIGETPDFGEDWDGLDPWGDPWVDEKIFDFQSDPTAIFADGVTFKNVGAADADKIAQTDDDPGSTDAIGAFAWDGHEDYVSRMIFPNGADYVGFFIFDTDHGSDATYTVRFSDNQVFTYDGAGTDQDKYRFIGLVNNNPSGSISRLDIDAPKGSHYGIDEVQWGRRDPGQVPEPASILLTSMGLLGLAGFRKRTTGR